MHCQFHLLEELSPRISWSVQSGFVDFLCMLPIYICILNIPFTFYCLSFTFFVFSSFQLSTFFRIFFFLFRATPVAYGSSQGRGRIRATAAGPHHSHSNMGSEPRRWPTPSLHHCLIPDLLSKARYWTHILVGTSQIHFCCTAMGMPQEPLKDVREADIIDWGITFIPSNLIERWTSLSFIWVLSSIRILV